MLQIVASYLLWLVLRVFLLHYSKTWQNLVLKVVDSSKCYIWDLLGENMSRHHHLFFQSPLGNNQLISKDIGIRYDRSFLVVKKGYFFFHKKIRIYYLALKVQWFQQKSNIKNVYCDYYYHECWIKMLPSYQYFQGKA